MSIEAVPPFDPVCVDDVYQRLADCIERIGALDRHKQSREVHQMLGFLWAAHDTLDVFKRLQEKP